MTKHLISAALLALCAAQGAWAADKSTQTNTGKSCIPNTPVRHCQSSCQNGNCVVTYANGCKVRVRVSPTYNPMTSQFEFPSLGC